MKKLNTIIEERIEKLDRKMDDSFKYISLVFMSSADAYIKGNDPKPAINCMRSEKRNYDRYLKERKILTKLQKGLS